VKRKHVLRWILAGGVWAASAACLSPPVESPKTNVIQQTPIRVPQNEQNQVDILFAVDNSPSMTAMQDELRNKFGEFFTVFQSLAASGTYADLNIGVVTSDYGASDTDDSTGGCLKAPGPAVTGRGLLQTTAAAMTPLLGCAGPVGTPFIHYVFAPGGATANLPGGATDANALVQTFTCMASVGANGCGFEHQLESVYAALKNNNENKGFLRPGALLTVVFVTNEDDGSAPSSSKIFNPTVSTAPPSMGGFGLLDTYRQTDFGVACQIGGMLQLTPYGDSGGSLSGCISAPNQANSSPMLGGEFDVSRYISFFTKPTGLGGVKDDPANNVILVGIDAPEAPVSTIIAQFGTGKGEGKIGGGADYSQCPAPAVIDPKTCLVRLQHSCQNTAQPPFFGDPAVRLNTVINSAHFKNITSICGADLTVPPDYTKSLQAVANLISSAIRPGCITAKLTNPPDCVVEDVTTNADGTTTEQQFKVCNVDPATKQPTGPYPCYLLEQKTDCMGGGPGTSPDGKGVTIYRNGVMAAPNTSARVECSTVAS
jgi:hypothetical protein